MTTRRDFLKVIGSAGGALILGVDLVRGQDADLPAPFEPNLWVSVHPDGSVLVRIGKVEMGQGVRTSFPMIVAEEMDIDLARVRIEQATPGPDYQRLGTGGSSSIMSMWRPLRIAGSAARLMLISAAARKWNVEASTLVTAEGSVLHPPSNRSIQYGELTAIASTLPVPENPALKDPKSYRIVGRPQKKIDGLDVVTGRARYGLDVRVPGMQFAVIARAPQLGSKLESFDATEAKKVPGVTHVYAVPSGVAVVATNTWAAIRGREALTTRWTDSPHASFDSDEHMKALIAAIEKPAITIRKDANGIAGFETAARRIDALYLYPYEAHAPVEPVNCTVLVTENACRIWSPTQTPNSLPPMAAQKLSISESDVTVELMLVGGGFGRRLGHDFDSEAVEVARQVVGTPVQLVWTREDDMRHGYFQAASAHRLSAGLDAEGRVVAWEHRKASSPHNARRVPTESDKVNPETVRGWAWGVYDSPYFVEDSEMSYAVIDSPLPIGPWRAVFSPPSVFAREGFVDEIAEQTGKDPIDLRMTLLGFGDETIDTTYTVGGETIDRTRMLRVLEQLRAKSGWGSPLPAGRARGMACNRFHTNTYIAYAVEVSLREKPRADQLPFIVHRVVCVIDCGLAINPLGVEQQVESGILWSLSNMKGEITVRKGAVQEGYYSDFHVATIEESPTVIETHIVEGGSPVPHGIGEPTVCPMAPAVTNALSRLTGTRIRRLPVRAADLVATKVKG